MPEGVGYGPQNTASTGTFNILGKHAYAYSGVKVLTSSFSDFLRFETGAYYFIGTIGVEGEFDDLGQSQIRVQLKMNDIIVFQSHQAATSDSTVMDFPTPVMIPPFTQIVISGSQNSGGDVDFEIMLVGRLYK